MDTRFTQPPGDLGSLRRLAVFPVLAAVLALAAPRTAGAFCGFYVSGASGKLSNNATQVVLMRDGQRTVLSMQNNYQGPPRDFAMVVPVPVVLREGDVKTLDPAVFDWVDKLAAPRLVEYWEEDPCLDPSPRVALGREGGGKDVVGSGQVRKDPSTFGVKIEAKFAVAEYQILILSAQDSTGLNAWLRLNRYKIPAGADELLRPYVQAGMKFFVAKVDVKKVAFNAAGQAMLSPLRFHFDSDTFALPIRLGLLNARRKQDLIVHIIARGQRYEVANYPNVGIPTNLEVTDATRDNFPRFYAALFDQTLARQPGAVVTEYAWEAGKCDPCPGPPLNSSGLWHLGADVLPSGPNLSMGGYVLTRLHARYGAESIGEDLVFRAAGPIVGGREKGGPDKNEVGATSSGLNNFQARYIIRHPWTGPITCTSPRRGIWGPPPWYEPPSPVLAARGLAFVSRGASLTSYLKDSKFDVPALPTGPLAGAAAAGNNSGDNSGNNATTGAASDRSPGPVTPTPTPAVAAQPPPQDLPALLVPTASGGCGRCDVDARQGLAGAGLLALLGLGFRRIRPRPSHARGSNGRSDHADNS